MTTANLTSAHESASAQFSKASAQTQIVVLHYLAQKIRRASKSATPGAFFSQKVQTVLKQIQQMPKGDRHEALQEILRGSPTRLTEVYGELDTNMRMAFWYRLANAQPDEVLLCQSALDTWSKEQHALLVDLSNRESNELVSFLREAVATEATSI